MPYRTTDLTTLEKENLSLKKLLFRRKSILRFVLKFLKIFFKTPKPKVIYKEKFLAVANDQFYGIEVYKHPKKDVLIGTCRDWTNRLINITSTDGGISWFDEHDVEKFTSMNDADLLASLRKEAMKILRNDNK